MAKQAPRIRKTAPTIRERVEAEQAKTQKEPRKKFVQPVFSKAKAPLKRLKIPSFQWLPSPIRKVGRGIGKVLNWLAPRYFINAWREVRQVTWPSRRETRRLTGAVFIFALVFGTAVFFVDKGLDEIFKKVILK